MIKRIISFFLTFLVVSFFTFLLLFFVSGSRFSLLGDDVNITINEEKSENFFISYLHFLKDFFSLNWGKDIRGFSYKNEVLSRILVTFSLTFFSLLICIPLSFLWASFSSIKKNKVVNKILIVYSTVVLSFPSFLLSLFLSYIFSYFLKLFPVSGFVPFKQSPLLFFKTMFLPSISLALINSPILLRLIKLVLDEKMKEDYTLFYISEGAKGWSVLFNSALKPSLPFLFSLFANTVSTSLAGSAIIESVFSIPGIGSFIVQSANSRDFRAVELCVLVIAIIISFVFILSEIFSYFIDPRLKKGVKNE